MSDLVFVDTTVRDGQQSLWATNMRTAMLLPVMPWLDQAGFDAIEILATSFEKKMIRELKENPFERLRRARELAPNTPLRIIRGRHLAAFQLTPLVVEELWYKYVAQLGIEQVRSSDSSHTGAGWEKQVELGKAQGIDTIINLIFSISPRHTDEYYAEKAKVAAALNPFRICIKDPGALLTPERVRSLVPAIVKHTGDIPIEFHTHCNTGLGGLCTLEAIKLGLTIINTAVPPLAEGSSNPSVFDLLKNAKTLGYRTHLNESLLRDVQAHFMRIAQSQGLPIGQPMPYDAEHYIHQVPGGMISNLRFQLSQAGMGDRFDQVLEEIGRVREDFGYPIMVTPYSQFMGAQAVMNVMTGERYKVVSDEIIQYALGKWGQDESESVNPEVRDKVLSRQRATAISKEPVYEPTLKDLRRQYGGDSITDEELLLCFFADPESVSEMKAMGKSVQSAGSNLSELVGAVSKLSKIDYVHIQKSGLSIRFGGS